MTEISLNIHGNLVHDRDGLIQKVKTLRPDWIFILEDLDMALKLSASIPNVIYRAYNPFQLSEKDFDNQHWQLKSAKETAQLLDKHYGQWKDRLIFCFSINEPTHNDGEAGKTLDDHLKWWIDYMRETKALGLRVTVGEFATAKTVKQADVANGRWDDFLHALDKYRHWHIPSVHSYQKFHVAFDYQGQSAYLFDAHHPNRWHTRSLLDHLPEWSYEAPNYHIGRELGLLNKRADELMLNPFEYVITESFMDNADDHPESNQADKDFPYPPYTPLKGPWGHWHYWAKILGYEKPDDMSLSEFVWFMIRSLRWMTDVLPANCLSIMIFAPNDTNEWNIPHGFNVTDARIRDPFFAGLHEINNRTGPIPIPEPDLPAFPVLDDDIWDYNGIMGSDGRVYIREQPIRGDNVVEVVPDHPREVFGWVSPTNTYNDGTFIWIPVVIENGEWGWSAVEFLSLRLLVDKPLPVPEPPAPEPIDPFINWLKNLIVPALVILFLVLLITGQWGVGNVDSTVTPTPTLDPTPTQEVDYEFPTPSPTNS